jgi:hypothetical protein
MYRFFYFLAILFLPIIFGWWLFIPMALIFVYLIKLPYEIMFVAVLFDATYYFGEGFLIEHWLTLFSLVLIVVALFLDSKIHWQRII